MDKKMNQNLLWFVNGELFNYSICCSMTLLFTAWYTWSIQIHDIFSHRLIDALWDLYNQLQQQKSWGLSTTERQGKETAKNSNWKKLAITVCKTSQRPLQGAELLGKLISKTIQAANAEQKRRQFYMWSPNALFWIRVEGPSTWWT